MEQTNNLMEIVTTINQQLLISAPIHIQMSWGVSKRIACVYMDMPTLKLKVQGFEHKGWVLISLNEGLDLYEIRLMTLKGEVVKTVDQVFFDEMGDLVDRLVERGEGPQEKYFEKINEEYGLK